MSIHVAKRNSFLLVVLCNCAYLYVQIQCSSNLLVHGIQGEYTYEVSSMGRFCIIVIVTFVAGFSISNLGKVHCISFLYSFKKTNLEEPR